MPPEPFHSWIGLEEMTIASLPLLILDLDETLICASDDASGPPYEFIVGPYFVHRRPFLEPFLKAASLTYQLAVWSSSTEDYVAAVVRQIIPRDITLSFQWGRSRCSQRFDPELHEYYWAKDLKKVKRLGYNLDRVLIVEDSPEKVERSYGNAIYVKSYEGDPTDQELQKLGPYLARLAKCENFRRVEKRGWRLE